MRGLSTLTGMGLLLSGLSAANAAVLNYTGLWDPTDGDDNQVTQADYAQMPNLNTPGATFLPINFDVPEAVPLPVSLRLTVRFHQVDRFQDMRLGVKPFGHPGAYGFAVFDGSGPNGSVTDQTYVFSDLAPEQFGYNASLEGGWYRPAGSNFAQGLSKSGGYAAGSWLVELNFWNEIEGDRFEVDWVKLELGTAAVPEPAVFSTAAVCSLSLLARRRRQA